MKLITRPIFKIVVDTLIVINAIMMSLKGYVHDEKIKATSYALNGMLILEIWSHLLPKVRWFSTWGGKIQCLLTLVCNFEMICENIS